MQVSLKQNEIEAALKGYISQQGINVNGKQITIVFTAGRKASGITADLTIDDIELPICSDEVAADLQFVQIPAEFLKRDDEPAVQATPETTTEEVKTTSLFG